MNPETVVKVTRLRDAIKAVERDKDVPRSVKEVFRRLEALTNQDIPRID